MLRKFLKFLGYLLLIALVLAVAAAGYVYYRWNDAVYAKYTKDTPSIVRYFEEAPPVEAAPAEQAPSPSAEFDAAQFREPPLEFGPWTRWWWPGNDVDAEELRREIRLLADHGFAGVEVQPFLMGLDLANTPEDELERIYSYDTDAYFESLRTVMEAAREAGIHVDVTAAGGWPTGGPHVAIEDTFRMLVHSEETVSGGQQISLQLPKPKAPWPSYLLTGIGLLSPSFPFALPFYQDQAELLTVVAARIVENHRSSLPWNLQDQIVLDSKSVQVLGDHVENGVLTWSVPEGSWQVIGLWTMPAGEKPTLVPTRDPGLVLDHFDTKRVIAHYNYMFGKRSGLASHYGAPFRAVFNDSYEFKVNRHFTQNFIEEFQKRRGYDVTQWLPAMMQPGYDNFFFSIFGSSAKPEFRFSENDARVNYDYMLTVSDLFIENFIDASNEWMARRGLQNRTQAYGLKYDVMRGLGHAQIPETEQLYSEGTEMFLRLVSSSAELYNRPLITSESVVFMGRDYMTSPQKIKIAADKLFTSGINQMIFHGTPYKYQKPVYGEEGWNPWSNAVTGAFLSFSTNISETDAYWRYQKQINQYIARSQYAVRRGKPSTDVLLYYPFLGLDYHHRDHEELLYGGLLKDVEPPPRGIDVGMPQGVTSYDESTLWLRATWPLIEELDRQGVSWAWVNDDSLQQAAWRNGAIDIRGNRYQAVLLRDVPWIQAASAERLRDLAVEGARVVVVGKAPERQPGYLEFEQNDQRVRAAFEQILAAPTALKFEQPGQLEQLKVQLTDPISYAAPYSFLKHIERELPGGRIVFFWNASGEDQQFALKLDSALKNVYWLDPRDGAMHAATKQSDGTVSAWLGAYDSHILYATTQSPLPEFFLSPLPALTRFDQAKPVEKLEQWSLQAGDVNLTSTPLFDWRTKPELRHTSALGVYTASFTLSEKSADQRYVLDLGRVYFTADVDVNGKPAGSLLFAPYRLDVTDFVQQGENQVEITVRPAQLNGYIGRGLKGEQPYERFKDRQDNIMAAGLEGPVQVFQLSP